MIINNSFYKSRDNNNLLFYKKFSLMSLKTGLTKLLTLGSPNKFAALVKLPYILRLKILEESTFTEEIANWLVSVANKVVFAMTM